MLELLKALVALTTLVVHTVSTAALIPPPEVPPPESTLNIKEKYRQVEIEAEIMKKIQQDYPACFLLSPQKDKELFEFLCPFELEYHIYFIPENISQNRE